MDSYPMDIIKNSYRDSEYHNKVLWHNRITGINMYFTVVISDPSQTRVYDRIR